MTDDNDSGSWMIIGFFACFLAIFPTAGVFILLLLVPWMIIEWVFPTVILSFLVFVAGGCILVVNKDTRSFLYSIILGGMVGVCTIILATVRYLSLIPVPLFGNALNATAAGVGVFNSVADGNIDDSIAGGDTIDFEVLVANLLVGDYYVHIWGAHLPIPVRE